MNFFLFLWLIFALLNPDPDPGSPLNLDPDPLHCFHEYISTCYYSPYMQILSSSCKTVLFLEVELSGLHVPTTSSKLPRRDSLKAAPHGRQLKHICDGTGHSYKQGFSQRKYNLKKTNQNLCILKVVELSYRLPSIKVLFSRTPL